MLLLDGHAMFNYTHGKRGLTKGHSAGSANF